VRLRGRPSHPLANHRTQPRVEGPAGTLRTSARGQAGAFRLTRQVRPPTAAEPPRPARSGDAMAAWSRRSFRADSRVREPCGLSPAAGVASGKASRSIPRVAAGSLNSSSQRALSQTHRARQERQQSRHRHRTRTRRLPMGRASRRLRARASRRSHLGRD
jgi:hypothetical protein